MEAEDVEEATDEDELVRCADFRGWNILDTSSALIVVNPPCAPLPLPHRGKDWRLGGDATAVICVEFYPVPARLAGRLDSLDNGGGRWR